MGFNLMPRTLRRYQKDGGTVAVLEPVMCIKRYAIDGGIVSRLEACK